MRVTWGSNDKTHVQEAIDKARPGEEIFFPAGIYHVYNISLKSNITLISTEGATLTQLIGDNFAALFNDSEKSLSEVTFKGLTFDGNNDSLVLNSNPCMMLDLANADNHSRFKILGCQVRNFAYGIPVRRTGHSFFEIADCNFTKIVGGFAIGFRNSDTRYIKITNCKFINCYSGIKIFPDPDKGTWNVCDHVLIERCHFEGDEMHNYPIQFGGGKSHKFDFRFAATHVTVKDCIMLGPSKWYHPVPNGSANQIALYGVKYFAVTGNISNDGGDGGIVIQDCQYGMVSRNKCERNFGPGIIISGAFINLNGNACINNCRRIELHDPDPRRWIRPQPAGIMLLGNDILVTNNLCFDDMSLSIHAKQVYGLALTSLCRNVIVGSEKAGSNFFIDNVPSPAPKDIFYEGGSVHEEFLDYGAYVAAGHFISESPESGPTLDALPAVGYTIRKDRKVLSYVNIAGTDLMGTIIFDVPKDSVGLESGKLLKITFTTSHSIKAISLKPRSRDTDLLNATVSFDGMPPPYWYFLIEITEKATAGKTYIWDYQVD